MLPNNRLAGLEHIKDQHGTFEQVPDSYKELPIITVVRNPYDRYVSRYKFRWWAKNPFQSIEIIQRHFPSFPNLTFTEFLKYQDYQIKYRLRGISLKVSIGFQTVDFIQMFFCNPYDVLSKIDEEYINSDRYKDDIPDLRLLKTENINNDLYHFLEKMGYPKRHINFILKQPKIYPPGGLERADQEDWHSYYSESEIKSIWWKERFLFKIYSEFGINYPIPV